MQTESHAEAKAKMHVIVFDASRFSWPRVKYIIGYVVTVYRVFACLSLYICLLSYYLANKRSLHVRSQGLEIPTLVEEK